jgi:phosphoribosylamine--glycine ligase
MNVLLIGSGGREHALAWKIASSPLLTTLYAAPGNPGIAQEAEIVALDVDDHGAVVAFCRDKAIDLVVVGPEAPLVAGVADAVRSRGISCFGPSAAAARLEGSKAFAKDVMSAAAVPTARARVCTTPEQVAEALDAFGAPYVVKDDGLAAGKGVVVTDDRDAALAHAARCTTVVVEEFLDGPEVSLFALCGHDERTGTTVVRPLRPAQDFKRIHDGDAGPNTGGMGAYTPLPWAPDDLVADVLEHILQPTVDELARRGTPFTGLLYAGLALTRNGVRVVEFNVRFGDPETQPLLALLDSPLGVLLEAAAGGRLDEVDPLRWKPGAALTVVMASAGYPETSSKGDPITGVEAATAAGCDVIHAGTALAGDDLVTAGGRVLAVTAVGPTLAAARATAYAGVAEIDFAGKQFRTDIALAAST